MTIGYRAQNVFGKYHGCHLDTQILVDLITTRIMTRTPGENEIE